MELQYKSDALLEPTIPSTAKVNARYVRWAPFVLLIPRRQNLVLYGFIVLGELLLHYYVLTGLLVQQQTWKLRFNAPLAPQETFVLMVQ